uniref:Uncharacterized protein n=1 Tax=Geospiza parvula TaxID=87175 RepID=A0A8C3NJM8_GEOPR
MELCTAKKGGDLITDLKKIMDSLVVLPRYACVVLTTPVCVVKPPSARPCFSVTKCSSFTWKKSILCVTLCEMRRTENCPPDSPHHPEISWTVVNCSAARLEVHKFGITGYKKQEQRVWEQERAVMLGAKPPKKAHMNYRTYQEKLKEKKAVKDADKEKVCMKFSVEKGSM